MVVESPRNPRSGKDLSERFSQKHHGHKKLIETFLHMEFSVSKWSWGIKDTDGNYVDLVLQTIALFFYNERGKKTCRIPLKGSTKIIVCTNIRCFYEDKKKDCWKKSRKNISIREGRFILEVYLYTKVLNNLGCGYRG
jgi:hypothetical protein